MRDMAGWTGRAPTSPCSLLTKSMFAMWLPQTPTNWRTVGEDQGLEACLIGLCKEVKSLTFGTF